MFRRSNPDSDWLKSIILFIHPIFSPVTSTFSWLRPYMFIAYKIQIFVLKFRFWMIVTPKPRFPPDFPGSTHGNSLGVHPRWWHVTPGLCCRRALLRPAKRCGPRRAQLLWRAVAQARRGLDHEKWGELGVLDFFLDDFLENEAVFLGLRLTKNGVHTIVGGCIFEDESMLV